MGEEAIGGGARRRLKNKVQTSALCAFVALDADEVEGEGHVFMVIEL